MYHEIIFQLLLNVMESIPIFHSTREKKYTFAGAYSLTSFDSLLKQKLLCEIENSAAKQPKANTATALPSPQCRVSFCQTHPRRTSLNFHFAFTAQQTPISSPLSIMTKEPTQNIRSIFQSIGAQGQRDAKPLLNFARRPLIFWLWRRQQQQQVPQHCFY